MMGQKERCFAPLVNVSLEGLVPHDHFYRHLERTLDLSFVREFVQETYAGGGRPSIDPVVFFKLQLVMFFEGIRSERLLMRHGAPCHALQYPVSDGKNEKEVLWVKSLPRAERQREQQHAPKARRGQSVVATGLARPARYGESCITRTQISRGAIPHPSVRTLDDDAAPMLVE